MRSASVRDAFTSNATRGTVSSVIQAAFAARSTWRFVPIHVLSPMRSAPALTAAIASFALVTPQIFTATRPVGNFITGKLAVFGRVPRRDVQVGCLLAV